MNIRELIDKNGAFYHVTMEPGVPFTEEIAKKVNAAIYKNLNRMEDHKNDIKIEDIFNENNKTK